MDNSLCVESPPGTNERERVANGVRVCRPVQDRRALRLPAHRRQKSADDAAPNYGRKKAPAIGAALCAPEYGLQIPVAELATTGRLLSCLWQTSRE